MPMMRQFGLSHESAVEQFIAVDEGPDSEVIEAISHAWKSRESGRDATGFLVLRTTLLNRIGAAYAARDHRSFKTATDAFLFHSLAKSKVEPPSAAFLSLDMGLAICTGRHKDAKLIGKLALIDRTAPEQPYPTALCGHVLAALTDLDWQTAEGAATVLQTKCAEKTYSKLDCEMFSAWARAATLIAGRGTEKAISVEFTAVAALRRKWIDRELGRWLQGRNTDLTSSEFFDWSSAALGAAAGGLGYRLDQEVHAMAFADWRWTRGKL